MPESPAGRVPGTVRLALGATRAGAARLQAGSATRKPLPGMDLLHVTGRYMSDILGARGITARGALIGSRRPRVRRDSAGRTGRQEGRPMDEKARKILAAMGRMIAAERERCDAARACYLAQGRARAAAVRALEAGWETGDGSDEDGDGERTMADRLVLALASPIDIPARREFGEVIAANNTPDEIAEDFDRDAVESTGRAAALRANAASYQAVADALAALLAPPAAPSS